MTETDSLSPGALTQMFTRHGGAFSFARWGRPIVPVVFGVEEETLQIIKGALEAVVSLAGHKMAETDPELGANLMIFFFREWQELLEVPDLGQMIEGLPELVGRLGERGAGQYRVFRYDGDGTIRACFSFVRMGPDMADVPADTIALVQAVQMILDWGDEAFAQQPALASLHGTSVLRPEVAAVIAAGYDPVLPGAARDETHAMRLSARAKLLHERAVSAAAQNRRDMV